MIQFIIITSHFYSAAHLGLWRPSIQNMHYCGQLKCETSIVYDLSMNIEIVLIHVGPIKMENNELLWVSSTIAHKFLTFSAKHQDHDQLSITMKARRARTRPKTKYGRNTETWQKQLLDKDWLSLLGCWAVAAKLRAVSWLQPYWNYSTVMEEKYDVLTTKQSSVSAASY